MFRRLIASLVCFTFIFSNFQYVHAQAGPATGGDFSVNQLPVPGTMVGVSTPFAPLALKGLIVNPQKPLEFQFIVDTGNSLPKGMSSPNALVGDPQQEQLKQQANQLVKYFLAGLTIPEGDLWVNLSPYEKDRMVPMALGQTDLGRDLLAQDYILKQLTASLIYPEKDLGKEFWSRVYSKAQQQFGTTNVPVNTFNKVWILPDQAQVFENGTAAYVTKSTLKVMLDEDYMALQKHTPADLPAANQSAGASQVIREIILPELEKEVNTGKNFAPLRQIYQALILAKWYKETIQNGLLDAVYTNKKKVAGVNLNDPAVKEQIYNRYLQAYKKGAFNYIKEDLTPDGQTVPRKYFSGGTEMQIKKLDRSGKQTDVHGDGAMISLTVAIVAAGAAVASYALYRGLKGDIEAPTSFDEGDKNNNWQEFMYRRGILEKTTSRYQALLAVQFIASHPSLPGALTALFHAAGYNRFSYIREFSRKCLINISTLHRDQDIRNRASSFLAILETGKNANPSMLGKKLAEITQKDLAEEKGRRVNVLLDSAKGITAFPTTIRLIKDLKAANIKIGVGTGSSNAEKVLSVLGLSNAFDVLVDANVAVREDIEGKPFPDFYVAVAKKLGVDPKQSIVIEDAVPGVESAVRGGFGFIIALARENDEEELRAAGADLVLKDIGDLSVDDIRRLMPNLMAVIFDMDGVISDTNFSHFQAMKETMDEYFQLRETVLKTPITRLTEEEFVKLRGLTKYAQVRVILESRGINIPRDSEMPGPNPASQNAAMNSAEDRMVSNTVGGGSIQELAFLRNGQKREVVLPNGLRVQLQELTNRGLWLSVPSYPQLSPRQIIGFPSMDDDRWFYYQSLLVLYRHKKLSFYQIHTDLNVVGFGIHEDFLKQATGLINGPNRSKGIYKNVIGPVDHLKIDGHQMIFDYGGKPIDTPIDLQKMRAAINTQQDVGEKIPLRFYALGINLLQRGLQNFFLQHNCQIFVEIKNHPRIQEMEVNAIENDAKGLALNLNIMVNRDMPIEDFWRILDTYLQRDNLWGRYMPYLNTEELKQELLSGRIIFYREQAMLQPQEQTQNAAMTTEKQTQEKISELFRGWLKLGQRQNIKKPDMKTKPDSLGGFEGYLKVNAPEFGRISIRVVYRIGDVSSKSSWANYGNKNMYWLVTTNGGKENEMSFILPRPRSDGHSFIDPYGFPKGISQESPEKLVAIIVKPSNGGWDAAMTTKVEVSDNDPVMTDIDRKFLSALKVSLENLTLSGYATISFNRRLKSPYYVKYDKTALQEVFIVLDPVRTARNLDAFMAQMDKEFADISSWQNVRGTLKAALLPLVPEARGLDLKALLEQDVRSRVSILKSDKFLSLGGTSLWGPSVQWYGSNATFMLEGKPLMKEVEGASYFVSLLAGGRQIAVVAIKMPPNEPFMMVQDLTDALKAPDNELRNALDKVPADQLKPDNEAIGKLIADALIEMRVSSELANRTNPAMVVNKEALANGTKPSWVQGGIDLNQINVNRTGKTINVQFDPAQLDELMQGGFEGFSPVIINITSIQSPLALLGVGPAKEEASLTGA